MLHCGWAKNSIPPCPPELQRRREEPSSRPFAWVKNRLRVLACKHRRLKGLSPAREDAKEVHVRAPLSQRPRAEWGAVLRRSVSALTVGWIDSRFAPVDLELAFDLPLEPVAVADELGLSGGHRVACRIHPGFAPRSDQGGSSVSVSTHTGPGRHLGVKQKGRVDPSGLARGGCRRRHGGGSTPPPAASLCSRWLIPDKRADAQIVRPLAWAQFSWSTPMRRSWFATVAISPSWPRI